MNNRIPVIALLGPTAIGKSKIALELYDQCPIEIVSVDSAMIYKDMDIGTDKPTHEVLASKKHHLIDIRNPNQNYNVGDFYSDVNNVITETPDELLPDFFKSILIEKYLYWLVDL